MINKPTKVLTGNEARKMVLKGVNVVYDPVRMTLGPAGQNALVYRTYNRGSRTTNDGVTVAKLIEPKNEFENLVAGTFRESAEKTNQRVGDGTTSTIVIAGQIINKYLKEIAESSAVFESSVNVMDIKRMLQKDLVPVIEKIKEKAHEVKTLEDLEKIAIVSVEDPVIGKIIAKVAFEVGVDGFVDVVEGYKGEIETEVVKGMRFPAKVAARAFITNFDKFESIIEEASVLVTNYKIENDYQIAFLNDLVKSGMTNIALFAPSFSEQVLITLVGAAKKNIRIFPIAVPSRRTEELEDLAIYTGGIFVNKDTGFRLENVKEGHFGTAQRIIAKDADAHEDATVIGGGGENERTEKIGNDEMPVSTAVQTRINDLKKQIAETKIDMHKKSLERRIASMGSAVGVIRVGGPTDAEILYKKLKIEDGVYATKAALKEGYVKGGGLCLKEIADELPGNSLIEALQAPYEQIQKNNGQKLDIGEDIIDPAMVVRLEMEHAVSIASNLITVGILIPEEREASPYEGNQEIAKAINLYNFLWNKKESVLKENEFEMRRDEDVKNQEIISNDTG